MKTTLTLLAICICMLSMAQAPQALNYQSVVRNSSGTPIANQAVGFQINILQGSPTGNTVYTETHNVTTNQFGLATFLIGQGITTGNFSSINWGAGPFYTQVLMDATGGTNYQSMGAATELVSVPYALYAASAGGGSGSSGWGDYAMYTEDLPSGTASGETLTSLSWNARSLNHTQSYSGSSITLSGNSITLAPGRYYINASLPWGAGYNCFDSSTVSTVGRLRNTVNNLTILVGQSQYINPTGSGLYQVSCSGRTGYVSTVQGVVNIISSTTFQIQQYFNQRTTYLGLDGGWPALSNEDEIYSTILIQKIQ